jgi:hypothetical protein
MMHRFNWPVAVLFLMAAPALALADGEIGRTRLSLDQDPPAPGESQAAQEEPDQTAFYPVPALASGKNEGWTYGLLGALLIPDARGEINMVLSAAIQYRSHVGLNGFADFRWTLTPTGVFEVYSYWAAKVENENQVFMDERRLWKDYNFRFDFDEKRVGTERYFGKGISTDDNAESAYTSNQYFSQVRFGPYLTDVLSLQGTFRFRHFRVGESILTTVPQTLTLFPNDYGIEGGMIFAEGLRLVYDTRNNIFTPTRGEYAVVFVENDHYVLHDAAHPYQGFGIEGTKLWPHTDDAQFVSVAHLKAQFVVGKAPFWELPALGGGSSLRSYNPNRFTDNDTWVINLEERIRVYTVRVEGVTAEIQVAPFVDFGEALRATQDVARPNVDRRVHWSVGSGVRAVVPPYIVGRMDIAWGTEGIGITVGLDYPF